MAEVSSRPAIERAGLLCAELGCRGVVAGYLPVLAGGAPPEVAGGDI